MRLHVTNVFHADHFRPAGDSAVRPEPRHTGFHQSHANGFEILHHHFTAFLFAHFREAQFQVAMHNFCASFHKT
ncbi:Uncharacterised protein [Shigella sonnei]|nr:Uncharacterised protein [Shigella sonnei]CSG47143.1 Uncharacterised protein [Shigella sonnei]CSI35449.1 Uncharacterised protein [Shigella sonnei]CSP95948.1 Uncharacterised protein [Shigella sonnei]CSQ01312.1 Uncharacterised protein [Shigella sonnei]